MSQKSDLLQALRMGPVCSFQFYQEGNRMTHRLAARIWDLKQDGNAISTRACTMHDHEANAVIYELAEINQLSLNL